jgi:hypothetical protein
LAAGVKIDLMGGKNGLKGYINYDIAAKAGIADDVANFKYYFGSNSVSEVVVNNPMNEFLSYINFSIKKGGTISLKGQFGNKHFRKIWDSKVIDGYDIIKRTRGNSSQGYKKSNGKPIHGLMNEIILKKL